MSEPPTAAPKAPRRRVRFGRILLSLLVVGVLAGGAYGASWLNARRYFLVVGATEVQVHKGRMLPVGHEPFVPFDADLRRAYRALPLPGGLKLPRGETVFDDRVQLDQALYRILVDAAEYALAQDNARTSELVQHYIEQLKALPGTNVRQHGLLTQLERAAGIVEARGHVTRARALLERAETLFRAAAVGGGPAAAEGLALAGEVARARAVLDAASVSPPPGTGGAKVPRAPPPSGSDAPRSSSPSRPESRAGGPTPLPQTWPAVQTSSGTPSDP